jgi:hypothetical protein
MIGKIGLIGICTVGFFSGSVVAAQNTQNADPAYPSIGFRRVTPLGADHTGPRITVQIAPRDNPAVLPRPGSSMAPATVAAPSGGTDRPDSAHEDWFWTIVAPDGPGGPARFLDAMIHLRNAPEAQGLGTPRLNTLNTLAGRHGVEILLATVGTQVSPALVIAVMSTESAGRSDAVSHAGAQGLMQLIPDTAARFGVEDSFDTAQNIAGGVAYLDWLMDEFDRDPIMVIAAYNAGEGAVRRAGGVPDYAETRRYVPKVLAAWDVARGLCLNPPELVSDGCVFRAMTSG